MIFYATIIISIIGLCIATYTDLKERIVEDKLNFGLGAMGLIIGALVSLIEMSIWPIFLSAFGLCAGFLFGWIMWKLGVFAGGDVKLFMGLGALNPFTPALINFWMLSRVNIPLFPLTLFIHSLIAFFPYGIIIVLYKLKKNKKFRAEVKADMKKRTVQGVHLSIVIAGLSTILFFFSITQLIVLPLLIVWGFLGKKKIIITIVLAIVAGILNWSNALNLFIGSAIMIVGFYGVVKLLFSLRPLLTKEIEVVKLEEGMIPGKTLFWEGKKVAEAQEITPAIIIKYVKEHRIKELFAKKDEIISARKARGLTIEEIKEVKALAKKGLIGKMIPIKESMPFVPTMLIGYIICLILGDFFWVLLGL